MALTKVGKEGVTGISNSSNATAITIDSSERVGIGTTSPSSPLAIETGSIASLSTYDGHIVVGPSSRTSSSGDLSGGILFDQANGVQVSGKKGASITGVQDTSDVNSMGITFNVHGTDGSANRFEAMRLDSSGNLLVGATAIADGNNSTCTISTGGTISTSRAATNSQSHHVFYNPNGSVGNIATNGSATAYNTSSDYRLKTAVNYDWDATTRLKQLRPARFKWIADGDNAVPVDGFLAHEAAIICPESVTGTKDEVDADGNPIMQGIDQSKIVPLLVKTLQEAITKIETLETKVQALEDA